MLRLAIALCVFATLCSSSKSATTNDLVGTFSRQMTGMYIETLSLRSDGSYIFTLRFDIGSDEERGEWAIRDSMVVLSPKRRGEVIKRMPSRFRVVVIDGIVALSVIEDATASHPEGSETRLFRRPQKQANKAPEPTSGTVTSPAEPGAAPVPPVAHL